MTDTSCSRKFDAVFMGYGFHGRLALQQFLKATGSAYRVGVAGRNSERLRATLAQLGLDQGQVGAIQVDAGDYVAAKALAAETRVILACLPDFGAVGDALVRACAEEGTHYFDISGDTATHQEWRELYGDVAAASGSIVVPGMGFDYVVADFGAQEVARLFAPTRTPIAPPAAGGMSSLECYSRIQTGPRGLVLREHTFHEMLAKLGAPAPPKPKAKPGQELWGPAGSRAGGGRGGASLLQRLQQAAPLQYSRELGVWTLPGFQYETAVFQATNAQLRQGPEGQPVAALRFDNRMVVPSPLTALLYAAGVGLFLLVKLPFVRSALGWVAPPVLRRLGVLTQDDSCYKEAIQAVRVKKVFVGRGCRVGNSQEEEVHRVAITSPTCATTFQGLALAGITVLGERGRMGAPGISTPVAAFRRTSFWARLKEWSGTVVEVEPQPGPSLGAMPRAKQE